MKGSDPPRIIRICEEIIIIIMSLESVSASEDVIEDLIGVN